MRQFFLWNCYHLLTVSRGQLTVHAGSLVPRLLDPQKNICLGRNLGTRLNAGIISQSQSSIEHAMANAWLYRIVTYIPCAQRVTVVPPWGMQLACWMLLVQATNSHTHSTLFSKIWLLYKQSSTNACAVNMCDSYPEMGWQIISAEPIWTLNFELWTNTARLPTLECSWMRCRLHPCTDERIACICWQAPWRP